MIKNIFSFLLIFFSFAISTRHVLAADPGDDCGGHPICGSSGEDGIFRVIGDVIALGIQYVAVIAVLAVMLGGVMYLLSNGQEEKTKQAKNIIIWALVGTFISVAAWSLISIVNNFRLF